MKIPSPARKSNQGSILLLTLFFMILISLLAVAFWKIIPVDLHSAQRHKDDTRAYYAADAGVVDTMGFLSAATTAGNVDQLFADSGSTDSAGDKFITRTGKLDGIDWTATVTPGPDTYGHHAMTSQNPLRVYRIDCTALIGPTKYRSVTAWLSQDSFAEDNWLVGQGAGGNALWLNFATFRLGGSYHTNDYLRLNIPTSAWWSQMVGSAVGGSLTSSKNGKTQDERAKDGVLYNNWDASMLPFDSSGGAVQGRYEKISAKGKTGIQAGVAEKTLPSSTDSVAFGAWGATPPVPGTLAASGAVFGSNSVNVRINGATAGGDAKNGLFIEGNVDQIDLDLVNEKGNLLTGTIAAGTKVNQRVRIDQGNNEVDVIYVTDTYELPAGSKVNGSNITAKQTLLGSANNGKGFTVVKKSGVNEFVVYKDQTNGAIYSTGDINGLRGVTMGRRTIATLTGKDSTSGEMNNDKRITITGELTYAGTTRGQVPASSKDQLGLIAYAVKMGDAQASAAPSASDNQDGKMWPPRNTTSPTNPLYLYCSIFAGRNKDPRQNASDAVTTAGGFGVNSYTSTALGPGQMKMYGSLTEGIRLAKGQFDQATGNGTSGYQYNFQEDPWLKEIQPPFFPSLPNYGVVSWEEKSVFAY